MIRCLFEKLLICAIGLGLSAALPGATGEELQREALNGIPILPSQTDPEIKSFDTPHYVYINREIIVSQNPGLPADRHELLLWLPGTGGAGKGPGEFCQMAANYGYHVIVLMYPDDIPASVCRNDDDPKAFENFRMAIIAGGHTPHIAISRTDSIENRLIKLLLYLKQARPHEAWGQFLDDDGGIRWKTVAVAGQSQGGGHAALIGIKHRVTRVICTGAPKDYSIDTDRPAAWYYEEPATPKACFFSFTHQQDHQGCSPEQQLENLQALKLDAFGAPADVDSELPPYRHARILRTNYPGKKLESKEAHTSVISSKNEAVFGKVWAYMLTENAP